jgi:hypothetical protein
MGIGACIAASATVGGRIKRHFTAGCRIAIAIAETRITSTQLAAGSTHTGGIGIRASGRTTAAMRGIGCKNRFATIAEVAITIVVAGRAGNAANAA